VDEDDGRRRAVEHDGPGAPALVALPRGGDVDERPLARGCGRLPAQQEGPGGRGRLRDVGGHGRAEDVEAEDEVHRGADPELHEAEDEPRHLAAPATSARVGTAAACRRSSARRRRPAPLPRVSCYRPSPQEEEE
jgi:hypothetical protein